MRTRLLVLLVSLPAKVFACAVCMGAPGSQVADAGNGFIFFMLGFLAFIFTGIGGFACCLMRRAKAPLPPHEELAAYIENGEQHA